MFGSKTLKVKLNNNMLDPSVKFRFIVLSILLARSRLRTCAPCHILCAHACQPCSWPAYLAPGPQPASPHAPPCEAQTVCRHPFEASNNRTCAPRLRSDPTGRHLLTGPAQPRSRSRNSTSWGGGLQVGPLKSCWGCRSISFWFRHAGAHGS